jgi:monoamine oxidase
VNDVDVIVVGAGAAGLAALRSLLAAGCRAIALEARHRIGGRVWTDASHGPPFDQGASFIHAEHINPWTTIARRLGVATEIDRNRRILFVGDRAADQDELEAFNAARAQAQGQVIAAGRSGRDVSIADAVRISGPWAAQAQVALGPWFLGAENDAASVADFTNAVGGRDRLVTIGYGQLVTAYGRGVPVRLGAIVEEIDYRGAGVVVETTQGRLRGRLAIVTLPVGVLAAGQVRFDPPLPLDKQRALEALPMGLLAKIGLFFDGDPFGLGDTCYLHRQTTDQRAALYLVRPCGHDLVQGFVGGSLARELEAAGEAAARAFVLEPLVEIFGSRLTSRLRGTRHTGWGMDPFALGSYAVARPGAAAMRAVLRLPLADRVLFAGEACAGDGWAATVAGAHLSGKRAARAALTLLGAKTAA